MDITPEPTLNELLRLRRSIAAACEEADACEETELPNGYLNFELALAILDGCRDAIIMTDTHNPSTLIEKLAAAARALALLQSGPAEASVKATRSHLETAIDELRLCREPCGYPGAAPG